ncbi:acyltransferase domain-containing protein [Streptomyces sp. NPDC048282]|uniref:acyltransferase domain-containing protein n=1 Tax=Streptomyces sp. NPDC048282 TaxID=3365528 RepID=UPI0037152296
MPYTAVQFPGLGGYAAGALQQLAGTEIRVSELLRDIDRAAREYGVAPVSAPLTDPDGPEIEDLARTPTRLHLASLASGLAIHACLVAHGRPGDILIGHSTGELTALAAAGCLSAYDAARVLCEREIALAEGDFGGGLTALRIGARRAEQLCGAVGGWSLQPSLFNAPRQTVVSGNADELPLLEKAARALGIQATRLLVVYPHHNPVLAEAARQVAKTTASYRLGEPHIRVYSPLLGRPVRAADDVRRVIDRHLTDPVDYVGAIRELHAFRDVGTFLEAGPRPLLTQCAAECLPPDVGLVGPPPGTTDGRKIVDALLEGRPVRVPPPITPIAGDRPAALEPPLDEETGIAHEPPAVTVAITSSSLPEAESLPEADELLADLRRTFADALGYPEEVFTDDAHLEADLGIASVKKTELLVGLLDRYDLPTPPAELRMRDYNTLPKLAGLMLLLAEGADGASGER